VEEKYIVVLDVVLEVEVVVAVKLEVDSVVETQRRRIK